MASFNKVILLGNLTRDPQMRYLPSQTAVTDFGLACNRKYKTQSGEQREEVLFVDCSAFGRTAEIINQFCTKGKPLFVEGHLKLDEWEDKNGGGKRSKIKVMVDNVQLLGGRDGGPGGGGGGGGGGGMSHGDQEGPPDDAPPPRQAPQRGGGSGGKPPVSEEQQFKDDDIPF